MVLRSSDLRPYFGVKLFRNPGFPIVSRRQIKVSLALGLNTGRSRCLNSWYFYHFPSTSAHGILEMSSYCNHQTMYEANFAEESCIVEEFQFWTSRFALIWKKTSLVPIRCGAGPSVRISAEMCRSFKIQCRDRTTTSGALGMPNPWLCDGVTVTFHFKNYLIRSSSRTSWLSQNCVKWRRPEA